jgi:hypothetical protein
VNEIAFTIEASPSSNDHPVRVIVYGQDLIALFDEEMLGIDPPEFFSAENLLQGGELTVARCGCGVVGCRAGTVTETRNSGIVNWHEFCPEIASINSLTFSQHQFDSAVLEAECNHDWETAERTAERLISLLDFSMLDHRGLSFRWASGRLDKTKISACFDLHGRYQVIVNAKWDHREPEFSVVTIQAELANSPHKWSDVICYPQGSIRRLPDLSGPGWKSS